MWNSAIKRDHYFYGKINIFLQINVFTKEVTKELISRKFFERDLVSYYFSTVHTASLQHCEHTLWKRINGKFALTKIFFRQINSLVVYWVNSLFTRNFCHKRARVNFISVICTTLLEMYFVKPILSSTYGKKMLHKVKKDDFTELFIDNIVVHNMNE